tara:strand:+ start:533 stop:1000 length:468 start_codon:yes stop_codon:yes gene_type:complete
MPSQIKVDEIKNVAGQYKIKTDTFEGQTTAGSITVQGEGTATTNLQQGLAKAWINFKATDTVSNRNSHNVSTLTDNGTGDFSISYSSNMANINIVPTAASSIGNGATYINIIDFLIPTTSLQRQEIRFHNSNSEAGEGTNYDYDYNWVLIYGDLA